MLWILSVFILLIATAIFALQLKPVQTFVAKKAAGYLSKELHTRIDISSLYIKPFKSLVLQGLYIQDLDRDTLLYSPNLSVDVNLFSLRLRRISVNTARLDEGRFFLKKYKDGRTNLDFIINYFDSGKPVPKKKRSKRPYTITFDKIVLNHISFRYKNYSDTQKVQGINFSDVALTNLSTTVLNLDTRNHLFKAGIRGMAFREKSGFRVKMLNTDALIDSNRMEFKDLELYTGHSRIRNYLLLKFSTFRDFSDFNQKVYMRAHMKNATAYSGDIAYFTDALRKMNIRIGIDGHLSGFVNNFRGRNIFIKAGQATYLRGNVDIKGLPDINKAWFNIHATQLFSNKKDADNILKGLTGQAGLVPAMAGKFGNVNFTGQFTGRIKDFRAAGEFKTSLGRVVPDIEMVLGKLPQYHGTVKVYDFDLGRLLDQAMLGRASFTAEVQGQGFQLHQLNDQLKVNADYLDFKGYRYNNVSARGDIANKLFTGHIAVNDRNLKFDFNGKIDLGPALPEFNFSATVGLANLHKLGLTRDTLQAEAVFRSHFAGNTLNNVQGSLSLSQLRLTSRDSSLMVDSINLTASGLGKNRLLSFGSTILDASIRGEYDLNTLPAYFKAIAKKYVPSLKTKLVKPANQNFNLFLRVKDFAPFSMLFARDLHIPQGAVFYGRFVSADSIAAINGSSPLIVYKKLRVNNFILDESATSKTLDVFLTADRIDISDSLYIKNINIANIIRNDSLALNVKLSDKDATNQLDLNGLVEFGRDTLARLSILPSDVIINHEVWRIPEQVKFRFDKEKIFVSQFEMFRADQLLTIDGIISSRANDKLTAEFKKFKLATFNPLTRGAGVDLGGELNGHVTLSSVLKTPKIESELTVDTLMMNKTRIGDVKLNAGLDNETKLVNVKMDILKDGKETMNVQGTYNANASTNSLNLNLVMEDNELVIFQPAIKNLVSDVSGKVSAHLNVSGTILDPKINGNLSLKDARVTVNYLKTPYIITDKVRVENSVIQLDNLEIRDTKDNRAIATGSVDMHNPNNPNIDVAIRANHFMALNTTAKDNPLYYGSAFATGIFRFKGPVNNMKIDISAKAEEGTIFNIPLNASETIQNNDFITFVAKDSTFKPRSQSFFLPGLVLNMDLTVDENAVVNIFTNLGRLNGRGSGSINLKITSQGDFEMYGNYLISSGKFQFTAQDFINKIFDLNQGGSIRWTGDPAEALINLKAVYALRADVRPLYLAAGRATNEGRVQTEAIMNLSGSLSQPDISFDINFPTDAYIKEELQSYFSDVNNKNTQALSLIVRRSFSPNTGMVNVQAVNSTLKNAGTELVVNQFNNILAQWLNWNFLDLNIRSFNEASASLRVLNDRLIITGGVTGRSDLNDYTIIGNEVTRDVEMLYLIQKDGSLTARISNRLNNRNFLNLNPDQEYISAVGLVYRQDFETFGEFLRALIGKKRRDERRQQPMPSPSPVTPPTPSTAILPGGSEQNRKK